MVLRDYLELKVEIEGTSGEGSLAVKNLRTLVILFFVLMILSPYHEVYRS